MTANPPEADGVGLSLGRAFEIAARGEQLLDASRNMAAQAAEIVNPQEKMALFTTAWKSAIDGVDQTQTALIMLDDLDGV